MKKLIALSLAVAFAGALSSSALACQWGKMAKHDTMTTASDGSKTQEAMSTFDPDILDTEKAPAEEIKKPIFE